MNLKFNFLIVIIVTATSCDTTQIRSSKSCYAKKNDSSVVFKFIRQEGYQVIVQNLNTKDEIKLWNNDIVEIPCK